MILLIDASKVRTWNTLPTYVIPYRHPIPKMGRLNVDKRRHLIVQNVQLIISLQFMCKFVIYWLKLDIPC